MTKHFVQQYIKMMDNLDGLLVKAAAHADQRKFDVNNFMTERLAPDMLPFSYQVQAACDAAKFSVAYMSQTKAPSFPDTEKTWSELRERVAKTKEYLKTMVEADYSKYKEAKVAPSWAQGRWLAGDEQFHEMAIPNFYFHMSAVYMILRNTGVVLGKGDYLGALNFKQP